MFLWYLLTGIREIIIAQQGPNAGMIHVSPITKSEVPKQNVPSVIWGNSGVQSSTPMVAFDWQVVTSYYGVD